MDTTKLKARLEDKAKGLEKPAEAAPVYQNRDKEVVVLVGEGNCA